MRRSLPRLFVGACAFLAGVVAVDRATTDAAEAVPDTEFKALFDQDAKNILANLSVGSKDKKAGEPARKTADRAIKSNAMMIAAYAQSRITGKNAAEDAKMATLRDEALKVATFMTGKKPVNFNVAVAPAMALSPNMPAAANANAAKKDLIKEVPDFEIDDLMYHLKKTTVGGLNIEADIKEFAKKGGATPEKAAAIAIRVALLAELCDDMKPNFPWAPQKNQMMWKAFNKEMATAAANLLTTAKAKEKDPAKKLQAAFDKLDGSCVKCHDVFKER